MKLKKIKFASSPTQHDLFDRKIERLEFEIGENEYVITEDYDEFFHVRKKEGPSLLVKPGGANDISIR